MSAVKRTWKLELTQNNKSWTRIVRAEELKVGSQIGNHLRLPAPCPASVLKVNYKKSGLDWETPSESKYPVKKHKGALILEFKKTSLTVTDVTDEEIYQPFTKKKCSD